MKKIGILTFQQADNYGALLQAYALKQVLHNQGHQADIINYDSAIGRIHQWFKASSFSPWQLVKQGVRFPFWYYRHRQFEQFRAQYLINTPLLSSQQLPALNAQYDQFIAGSDQVFNLRITQFDENYFLAFNPDTSKNYSYAASFGFELKNLSEKEKAFIAQNLTHFNRLSIREKQGAQIVNELAQRPVQIHIDPTLLLTKKQWEKLMLPSLFSKPYILVYLMAKDDTLIDFAHQLSRRTGYKLIYIPSSLQMRPWVHTQTIVASIPQWLTLFANATYVITNSFHGIAFSINFNRPFFINRLPSTWPANSRLQNLLETTGLQDRLCTNFTKNYDVPMDWDSVNQKLDQERQKAFAYLQEITK